MIKNIPVCLSVILFVEVQIYGNDAYCLLWFYDFFLHNKYSDIHRKAHFSGKETCFMFPHKLYTSKSILIFS